MAIDTRKRTDALAEESGESLPRVVVMGLASCFGCQLQITNIEQYLTDVLGRIDLSYWQLTTSGRMPEAFDVAVVEGAVTTEEAMKTLREVRKKAKVLIAIGACATTAGIPGIASNGYMNRWSHVYETLPDAVGTPVSPRAISTVVPVDYEVRCCPIDPFDFVDVLSRVLKGSNKTVKTATLCGECKRNERGCFYQEGTMCLGLVTRGGCGARCPHLGRPCNGCAGLSPEANIPGALYACRKAAIDEERFMDALRLFNQTNPAIFS